MRATVLLHDDGRRARCRLMRDRSHLAVGDRVEVAWSGDGPQVVSLAERRGCIWRPAERGKRIMAAHVDHVVVVGAVVPELRPGLVDRFLVAADAEDIEAVLVLNKADLDGVSGALASLEPYREMGYPVLVASARTGQGLAELERLVGRGINVFVGHSGVGKSSLLNRLVPGVGLRTADVNAVTGKGKHTTSVTTCHPVGPAWPAGGLLVDTPGVRAFGLYGLELVDVAYGFRDLRPHRIDCRFRDCLHEAEPGCAVRRAVAGGQVARARYEGYLRILASVRGGDG